MVADHLSTNKIKINLEERTKLCSYFNQHIDDSWNSLTHTCYHVNTFTRQRIPSDDTITSKLHDALTNMRAYVNQNRDTLAHTSWPYELEENDENIYDILQNDQGLAEDHV